MKSKGKSKVLAALPKVYSLKMNDYSGFVVSETASQIMHKNWLNVGRRLGEAINKVGHGAEKATKTTS